MSSILHEQLRERVTPESQAFIRMSIQTVKRIHELMKAKGMSQTDLANALEKSPSEVSKWLSGMHNFTLKSLAKLEIVLGAPIIAGVQPPTVEQQEFVEKVDAAIAGVMQLKEYRERAVA